jgi:hypothetical protein
MPEELPANWKVTLDCTDVSQYQHALVLQRCFQLYQERNRLHQDAWMPGGLKANLVKLRLKVERGWRQHWRGSLNPTAELLDAINYGVFCIRCADDDQWDGGWDW